MGIVAAGVAIGVSAVATGVGIYEGHEAEESQLSALNEESKEEMLEYQQKSLANYDQLTSTLDAQVAAESVRGTAMGSPSFTAIQLNTENTGAKQQKNTDIEHDIAQQNINTERQNVRSKFIGDAMGSLAGLAGMGFEFNKSIPRSPPPSSSTKVPPPSSSAKLPGT